MDAVAAARLVTNGLDAFEGTAKRVESADESDDEADDGFLQPETREARRLVARLYRECAALETKLREREDIAEAEHSALSRRERETKLAYARKAIRHLSSSLRRRALLAWVLYLDEATRRRRLLRRAATKMRLRWRRRRSILPEYARMRRESRAERRLRDLENARSRLRRWRWRRGAPGRGGGAGGGDGAPGGGRRGAGGARAPGGGGHAVARKGER